MTRHAAAPAVSRRQFARHSRALRALGVPVATALTLTASATVTAATAGAAPASTAKCSSTHWVSSWGFSPTDGTLANPLVNTTLRQFAIPHLAGTRARLRFSNRYSTGPVTFGRVTIANQSTGAAVTPSTLKQVTFGGSTSVTIAAGADILSDPVTITMTPFHRLAVSTYIKGSAIPTQHFLAEQTSYQTLPASGDHTRDTSAAAFTIHTPVAGAGVPQAVYYLTGLDVLAPASTGTVAAFGDSITDGFQGDLVPFKPSAAPIDKQGRWPDRLAVRLAAAGRHLTTVDAGISSNQLTATSSAMVFAGPAGLTRFNRDVLAYSGLTDVIVLEGINDIGQSDASAATLISAYKTLIARIHAAGLSVQLGTITPQTGTLQPGYGAQAEPTRNAVNAWIRSQRLSNGVIDFDAAVRDPADHSRIRPAYDGGDHLHFNLAGYQAMANAVPLKLLAAARCTPAPTPGHGSTSSPAPRRDEAPPAKASLPSAATSPPSTAPSTTLAASGAATNLQLWLAAALLALGLLLTVGAQPLSEQLTATTARRRHRLQGAQQHPTAGWQRRPRPGRRP